MVKKSRTFTEKYDNRMESDKNCSSLGKIAAKKFRNHFIIFIYLNGFRKRHGS